VRVDGDAIELRVLGSSGTHTSAGRMCSGYLVSAGGRRVLVDAGNGSTANLRRDFDYAELDAVVISHRHVDHCVDLIGMYYALRSRADDVRLPLYGPADVLDTLVGMLSTDTGMDFTRQFAFEAVSGGDVIRLDGLRCEVFDAVHAAPAISMRFESRGRVLAYSGDSAGGDDLVACARDADLFLCEATWQGRAQDHPPGIHLVAADAGRVAASAGAGRLVLTHVAGTLDRSVSLAEARTTFHGPVELAEDLWTWSVPVDGPAGDGRPPANDGRPPGGDGRPPANDGRPPAGDREARE
jgi:ribonuclease BN (tRNA processing enzyme)